MAANAYLALAGYQILLATDTLVIFLKEVSMKNIVYAMREVFIVTLILIFMLPRILTAPFSFVVNRLLNCWFLHRMNTMGDDEYLEMVMEFFEKHPALAYSIKKELGGNK